MYMNPTTGPVPPSRASRAARRCVWLVVGGLFFAGLLALVLRNSGTSKLHPQIVLHTDLKTGGPLATISYADCIRASMGKVEGYPVSQARMIRPYFHPFLLMLHLGFASHRPVSISPDAVWLMICNGFAIHAEVRGEDLQRKMFPQGRDGKVTIKVRRDDFRKGSNNDWEAVFDEFATTMDGIMANDLKETLTGGFSTTGAKEKAAFEVVFMKTMERSFGYGVGTMCGIPSITLEGTIRDWQNLAARAEKLRGYDCDWWLDALKPVLAQFIAAAGGKVDRDFWRSIYKVQEQSGGDEVSGGTGSIGRNGVNAHGLTRPVKRRAMTPFTIGFSASVHMACGGYSCPKRAMRRRSVRQDTIPPCPRRWRTCGSPNFILELI